MKLREVCQIIGGLLEGDPDFEVEGIKEPQEAGVSDLVFLYHPRFATSVQNSLALAVVVKKDFRVELLGKHCILVDNPRYAFIQLVPYFFQSPSLPTGIHPQALVHPQAILQKNVSIGAFSIVEEGALVGEGTVIYPQVYVGKNVVIGRDCLVYPQVVIRENCVLGDRVILHSGVVVGADGFGYEWYQGRYVKVPHVGRVVIEDDVEIGANATIDRATLGITRIGQGSKIDNLVTVAHNVSVGRHVVIAAQSGIAGSSRVGDRVVMGGQSGVVDHCDVPEGVQIAGRAVVVSKVEKGSMVSGFPAQDHHKELRERALVRKLPEMWQKLKSIEEKLTRIFQHE
ncbi:MAG: UDP-3-O-(3-hydroxymyristoyl)glucosamine N-acyltransferase [Candidatus Atribacteria bacterium]|nr:UDP-3-O-(3-hydroxymyristoyl)glucosamine N-acyltransferase [Candidatus Atribacteria bacterium]